MMEEKRAIESFLETKSAEAFCLVYEAIYARVRRFFMLRGLDVMTAEDLAQNVGLKAYQRAGEVRDKALFYGWLFVVARNELHDFRRRRRALAEMVQFEPLSGELSELLSEQPEVLNDALLQEWLSHLEPAERDLIVLRFVEELSYGELADAPGVPVGTVKSRLFHAKRRLAQVIKAVDRRTQGLTQQGTVLTEAMRRGDFAGVANIYDPATDADPGPGVARAQFANNRIPDSRINPITREVLDFVPLPNFPGLTNNFRRNAPATETNDQYSVRVDHQFHARNQFFARFSAADITVFNPGTFPGFGTNNKAKPKNLTVSDIQTVTPNLINEFKFGYARLLEADLQENANGPDLIQQLGIPGVGFGGPEARGLPQFTVQNFSNFGDGTFALPRLLRNNTYQWLDNVTWLSGRHTVKGGVEVTRFQYNLQAWFQSRGFFQFNNGYTTRTATSDGTGDSFATYLLGLPFFSQRQVGQTRNDSRGTRFAAYAQDDFKVTPRLTLNLGLRYETATPQAEINGFATNVDPERLTNGRPTIFIGGSNGYPAGLYHTDKNNFAPRVGFAFRPFADAGTVMRGGYGVYFGVDDGNSFFTHTRNVPNIIPQTIQVNQFVRTEATALTRRNHRTDDRDLRALPHRLGKQLRAAYN